MNVKQIKKLLVNEYPIIVIYGDRNICEYISHNYDIKLDYYPSTDTLRNIIEDITDFKYIYSFGGIWLYEYDANNVSNLEVIALDTYDDRIVIKCGYKSLE